MYLCKIKAIKHGKCYMQRRNDRIISFFARKKILGVRIYYYYTHAKRESYRKNSAENAPWFANGPICAISCDGWACLCC